MREARHDDPINVGLYGAPWLAFFWGPGSKEGSKVSWRDIRQNWSFSYVVIVSND